MYWSYLTNTNNPSHNQLTFENSDDFNKLCIGYCELVLSNYFSSFGNDYNAIFISEFNPEENPFNKEIKFIINFDDIKKAKKYLGIYQ